MAQRAQVTSVEALESFKASLIVYLSKARPTLEEIRAEILRTRLWLQNDRRVHWESQLRRRNSELEQAKQSLFSDRLSSLHEATAEKQAAVHKAKRALEEAEAKLKLLRTWNREFESRVQPFVKQLEQLSIVLAHDMPPAVAYLAQAASTLEMYADISPRPASTHQAQQIDRKSEDTSNAGHGEAGDPNVPPGETS